MSESPLHQARKEAQQSTLELVRALVHLKEAVATEADDLGVRRDRIAWLLRDKKHAARDLVEKGLQEAEQYLDEKAVTLHRTLEAIRSDTTTFLQEMNRSIDRSARDLRGSVDHALGFLDDRRTQSWMTAFFLGSVFASLIYARALRRGRRN